MQEAVAAVQMAQPTWTEADLIRHLGERLPAVVGAMSAPDAARLCRSWRGGRWPPGGLPLGAGVAAGARLPAPRLGRERLCPARCSRYATGAQLAMEDRLLADAQETGAPRLEPATAARLLGADQARLEAQLQAHGPIRRGHRATGSGLRLDQAAAAFWVLTSARRARR